jgi:hypothetical protein
MGETRLMPRRSDGASAGPVLPSANPAAGPLSESDASEMSVKVNALSKEATDLRGKIKELETRYDTTKMTAKQHDKLVKQYLLKLFDVNRELLPLKEQMEKDTEEQERQRIRQRLEAMGVKVKPVKRRAVVRSRKTAATKVQRRRKNAKR